VSLEWQLNDMKPVPDEDCGSVLPDVAKRAKEVIPSPQSLSLILIHLVFSTRNREPFITPVHVHILFSLARSIAISDLVEEEGYGAFSIGQSNVAALKRYIRSQKQHHRRVSFDNEYRTLLKRYETEFDERYVWV